MGFTVKRAGAQTTVQDGGRRGYQKYGIAVAGVMDGVSAAIANFLVGNAADAPLLECMAAGPSLHFETETVLAVTGADMQPQLDGRRVENYASLRVPAGSELSFAGLNSGMFAYIAFAGGLDVPQVLGSAATHQYSHTGGLEGRALRTGDRLAVCGEERKVYGRPVALHMKPRWEKQVCLSVVEDRHAGMFTEAGLHTFYSSTYAVSPSSNRMGYRLDGAAIEHRGAADIITDGVVFGSVQVPASGTPIVMMADRQTTGGYSRIANVVSCDLPRLAQAGIGAQVRFRKVSVQEAQAACRDMRSELSEVRAHIEALRWQWQ